MSKNEHLVKQRYLRAAFRHLQPVGTIGICLTPSWRVFRCTDARTHGRFGTQSVGTLLKAEALL